MRIPVLQCTCTGIPTNYHHGLPPPKIRPESSLFLSTSVNTEAFQVELLKLVLSLVMLEEVVEAKRYEEGGEKPCLPFIQATLIKFSPEYPLAEQATCNFILQHQL